MKFKIGDWIELIDSEDVRFQSVKSANKYDLNNQLYDPEIQYGFYTGVYHTDGYEFKVITYNKPYQIVEIQEDNLDDYWFYFRNEYNVEISIPMNKYKHERKNFILSKQKIRENKIDEIC